MRRFGSLCTCAATASLIAPAALAGGLDRSGQPIGILFRDGNYAEVNVARTMPDVSGEDRPQGPPGFPFPLDTGADYDDVADTYTTFGGGLKFDVDDRVSVAIIGAEDFGSDIEYDGDPEASLLGGTEAIADTYAISVLARYKFTPNFSLHGGVRADRAEGTIKLSGLAYGGVNGYEVELDDDIGYGYLAGGAFEIPEIALRVALTYFSPIEHDFGTKESLNGASLGNSDDTEVTTPQAVNLDFQTGIAEDTLLFAGVRWAEWSEFEITPEQFDTLTGATLVTLDDVYTYTLGVGRQFTDAFSASAAFIYEEPNDRLVSPLSPSTGLQAVQLGAAYRFDQIEVSGGVRYSWLGDGVAETGTPDVARADFDDNTAVSVGLRIGYYF